MKDTKNLLIRMEEDDGEKLYVDLGPGDKVTVRGPMTKINDRKVVLAQSLSHDGDQVEIDRRQRQSTDSKRQASNN